MNLPTSPAVIAGDTLYFGGLASVDSDGNVVGENDIETQTRNIFDRMKYYLGQADMELKHLVYIQIYLEDLNMYSRMNQEYSELMLKPYPARKVIQTTLPLKGAVIEISGIASKKEKISLF